MRWSIFAAAVVAVALAADVPQGTLFPQMPQGTARLPTPQAIPNPQVIPNAQVPQINSTAQAPSTTPVGEAAQSPPTAVAPQRAAILSMGPQCAIVCANSGLSQTSCPPWNQTCLCNDNEWFTEVLQPCLLNSCTTDDGLAALNATTVQCQRPVPNRAAKLLQTIAWLAGIASAFIIARLLTKITKVSSWGVDDTTILIAWVMFTGFLPAGIMAIRAGFALDMGSVPSRTITRFLFYFFVLEPFYYAIIFLIKSSILFTYMRIFHRPQARKLFFVTHIFNLFQAVLFIALSFAQCQPLQHFWVGWTTYDEGGVCFNLSALPVSHASVGVAMDLWMIALPASEVLKLKLQRKDTIGALLMFGCGVFLTVVSCMRIPYLLTFSRPTNLTIDSLQTGIWTYIEVGVGIMVACMPNLRQFWAQLIVPKLRAIPCIGKRMAPPRTLTGGTTASQKLQSQSQGATACRDSAASTLKPGAGVSRDPHAPNISAPAGGARFSGSTKDVESQSRGRGQWRGDLRPAGEEDSGMELVDLSDETPSSLKKGSWQSWS